VTEKRERDAENERMREQVERKRRVETCISRSGIPARFREKRFADYQHTTPAQRTALVMCKSFAEKWPDIQSKGGSLVLTGGPGTGKTHLACAIGLHVAESFFAVPVFVTVYEMLRTIKSTYSRNSETTEADAIAMFSSTPDLLILDEAGVQVGSDHEKLLLFDVLNARYSNMRPTVLISNLSADDLEAYLGHRVMDRFRECGNVISFDWQSHRGKS
jgi:DNA replication protein DnaC